MSPDELIVQVQKLPKDCEIRYIDLDLAGAKEIDWHAADASASVGIDWVPDRFKPGDRVRHLYGTRDTGTIVGRCCGTGGEWMVRWDQDLHGPRELETFEGNMELLGNSTIQKEQQ